MLRKEISGDQQRTQQIRGVHEETTFWKAHRNSVCSSAPAAMGKLIIMGHWEEPSESLGPPWCMLRPELSTAQTYLTNPSRIKGSSDQAVSKKINRIPEQSSRFSGIQKHPTPSRMKTTVSDILSEIIRCAEGKERQYIMRTVIIPNQPRVNTDIRIFKEGH